MTSEIIIECKRVKFFAPHDEDAFFEWLYKIKSIKEVKGKRDSILLTLHKKRIPHDDLHSLVALFRRYKVPMKNVEVIVTGHNRIWFERFQRSSHFNMYPANQPELSTPQ
jgi:hypothetical protein